MAELTWGETMAEIAKYYRYFAEVAPGVTPREVGTLGNLWRHADALVAAGRDND